MSLLCHNDSTLTAFFGTLLFFFFFVLFCFLRTVFKDYSLLLASFFSKLMLPYWFHRLMNVKHQKLASLIMAGKGFKNSGICASEQRLYQQVPVTAAWKKKMVLIKNQHTWFPKGHLPGAWTLRFIKVSVLNSRLLLKIPSPVSTLTSTNRRNKKI